MESSENISSSIALTVENILKKYSKKNVTTGYTSVLSKLIEQFTVNCIARDLLAFSKHCGRKHITNEDAVLISRKTKFHKKMDELSRKIGTRNS